MTCELFALAAPLKALPRQPRRCADGSVKKVACALRVRISCSPYGQPCSSPLATCLTGRRTEAVLRKRGITVRGIGKLSLLSILMTGSQHFYDHSLFATHLSH